MSPAELAQRIAALDWSGTSLQHQLAVATVVDTLKGIEPMPATDTNVVTFPVKPRTCWTAICHLDGRTWAQSTHFGPSGAWEWVVESVMAEHGVREEQVSGAESGEDQPYDCDDLVMIDGLPVYRIQHHYK